MRRYVKEFANEFLNRKNYPEESAREIRNALKALERGMITPVEAVCLIADIHRKQL